MAILIGFLTFIMVLIAVFLILLVLVQLPKKEAGVGMAFGAGMSEMLLGAGSGNVLTRITKYVVIAFLGGALILSVLVSSQSRKRGLGVAQALDAQANQSRPAPTAPATPGLLPLTSTSAPAATPLISTTTVVNPAPAAATPAAATPAPAPAPAATTSPATPAAKPAGN